MSTSVQNIRIEPVNVTWQIEELTLVATVADVSLSLQSKYFLLNSGANAGFYVWINIDTLGVDPLIALKTAIPVAISSNASAATIATAISVAVDATAAFETSVTGNKI